MMQAILDNRLKDVDKFLNWVPVDAEIESGMYEIY